MQRKVAKVFKALSKKGMTQAYVEIDKKEYVYPMILENRALVRKKFVGIFILVTLLSLSIKLSNHYLNMTYNQSHFWRQVVNRKDRYGLTKLHHAVIQSDINKVKELLRLGAAINAQDEYGWTPLHWAVFKRDKIICRWMIISGGSATIKTKKRWFKYPSGMTPFKMAEIMKSPDILTILSERLQRP